MRIRNYLAILVLACLLGAHILERVLDYHFNHVQALIEKNTRSLLWEKDLVSIENSMSQFLVSTDLVIASGNTYLIHGTKNMGHHLTTEISKIEANNPFKSTNTEIKRIIISIEKIINYLDIISNTPKDQLTVRLSDLLSKYDPISLALFQDIQFISEETNNFIKEDSISLQEEKHLMEKTVWITRGMFLSLIFLLWLWANRKICKPLNGLINSSHQALAGNEFKAASNAPTEIIKLSNDFKTLTQTLFHQASHDPLTELQNRRAFERNLNNVINDKKNSYFLCFIDLDYFKTINDTCGHAAGDELLVRLSRILKNNVRAYDIVARLGGDEFAILIKNCRVSKVLKIANAIRENIHDLSYHWEGETFQLSASIGVAPKTTESTTTDLLNSADIACSLAKNSGRNTVHLFDINNESSTEKRQDMLSVHQINNAIKNNLFVLYKQDIVPLKQKSVGQHFEVLLRMLDGNNKIVSPASFLPIAERYQLSSKIDHWVINAVYDYLSENNDQVKHIDTISINLSGHSLTDDELEKFIINRLKDSELSPEHICFEITETAAITNTKRACLFMNNIKALGCKFALDDFGSGHSSYAYIKELPIDKIKIDGAFITNMLNNPIDYTTVKSICEIAKATHQEIIAEFVEEEKIVDALTELGVDYAQGYYFHKPEPLNKS